MSSGSAADGFRLSGSFEGCISGHDSGFSQRPYHKNCHCALHDKSRPRPGGLPPPSRCNSVSYPIRRSRSETSLAFAATTTACSPVAAPALTSSPSLSLFPICHQDDHDDRLF